MVTEGPDRELTDRELTGVASAHTSTTEATQMAALTEAIAFTLPT
jgi:hypothetical protein